MKDDTKQQLRRKPKVGFAVFLLVVGALILWSGISGLLDDNQHVYTPRGRINAEFVENLELQRKGLSGRENLGHDQGMMFVYDEESITRCFWMKDMNFAIDMIWLDEDKKVVHIKENVTPETYSESFCPDEPAQYVLEVASGVAAELEIEEGVQLRF